MLHVIDEMPNSALSRLRLFSSSQYHLVSVVRTECNCRERRVHPFLKNHSSQLSIFHPSLEVRAEDLGLQRSGIRVPFGILGSSPSAEYRAKAIGFALLSGAINTDL